MADQKSSMLNRILQECDAMADHARTNGLKPSGDMMQALETIKNAVQPVDQEQGYGREGKGDVSDAVKQATNIHNYLLDLVDPAAPQTLVLLNRNPEDKDVLSFLGPIPFIRRMSVVAIVCLAGLLSISYSSHIDGNSALYSLTNNNGWDLIFKEAFLIFAAGVGAAFFALFQAFRYVKNLTYDPVHESSYWIRFLLGIISGTLLALVVDFSMITGMDLTLEQPSGADGELAPIASERFDSIEMMGAAVDTGAVTNFDSVAAPVALNSKVSDVSFDKGLDKPIIAMLGGFSATFFYLFLTRIVTALEALLRGNVNDRLAAQEQASKLRHAEQIIKMRMNIASNLMGLQQQMNEQADPGQIKAELDRIQQSLLDAEFGAKGEG